MAICVALQPDGTLAPTGETVEACSAYVLVTASEHATQNVIASVFEQPTQEEAIAAFVAPFGAVLVLYLVAHMAGGVAGMFDKK